MRHSIGLLEPMFCKPFLSASDAYYFIELTSLLSFLNWQKLIEVLLEFGKLLPFTVFR